MNLRGKLRRFLPFMDPELYSRLGSIEAKVDILLERDITTDKRLAKLERFEARVAAIAAVVASIVAFIARQF